MSGSSYTSGQVLTAQELNASLDRKVDSDNAQITGGQITGVTVVDITGTADSTSPYTGALVVAGGAGIGNSLQVGGNTTVGGSTYVNGTTQSVSPTTGALVVAGGLGVSANANIGGSLAIGGSVSAQQTSVQSTTDSTNATNGALTVAGGAGVAKTLNVGGSANVAGSLNVTGATTVSGLLEAANFTLLAGGVITYADGSTQATAGAIDGELSINTTGGTTTITAAQAASNNIFKVTGALTSNTTIVFPAKAKNFTVQNGTTGSFSLTVKVSGQTPSVNVVQGTSGTLFTDTTGCYATSAASGIGFSGEFSDSTGLTLSLTHIGAFIKQTASGITTKLPVASTYPAGKGVVIGNKSTGVTNLVAQGNDTTELPAALSSGDVYFAESDGVSKWSVGWYSATKTLHITAVTFADGTSQTTANGTTMPTSTIYSVGAGNATLGASSLRTTGYVAPFVVIYRNSLKLISGVDYTLGGDNLTINLLGSTIGKNDQFEVLTNVVITPSTAYTPSSQYFTPAAGAAGISVVYTVGFVSLYQNGSRLVPGQDFTANDGANINFVGFTANGTDTFEVYGLTPMTYANSVAQSNPVLGGPLVFADGSSQGTAAPGRNRIINGAMRVDQRNSGAAQTITAAAALAYTVDRWWAACTGANVTGQRIAAAANSGAQYQYQFTGAASVTGIQFGQRIEATNSADLAGQTATLSAVLANSLLTTVTWTAYYATTADAFGTLASPTKTQIATGTFTVSATQKRYTAQIAIPAAATTGIEVVFSVGAQTSGTWTIGNAKLESGGAATPMEPISIAQEMALCQRYYEMCQAGCHSYSAASGGYIGVTYTFQANKRAAPSIARTSDLLINYCNTPYAQYSSATSFEAIAQTTAAGVADFITNWIANAEL